MNLIASWYSRIYELRSALAEGEAARLVPDSLSALYLRAREFHKDIAENQSIAEDALILSAIAVVVIAKLCCSS